MMKAFLMIVALAGGMALAACNTVRGAGEDVQSAANATDNAMHGD
jgi:predicted small secreted protein